MKKYEILCCGVTVQACDTLVESIVHFKNYVKRFGIDNVDILSREDNIQTIRIIISKED
ncbi:MAG: hypothetical protein IJ362_07380 [Oscillospiraceae bacterium]|nr:hypothetical protein [Oscillospiraceae bacterium]